MSKKAPRRPTGQDHDNWARSHVEAVEQDLLVAYLMINIHGERLLYALDRAALTTHELEWLEPWGKLAELELKCSNRELVYVGKTNVTQST